MPGPGTAPSPPQCPPLCPLHCPLCICMFVSRTQAQPCPEAPQWLPAAPPAEGLLPATMGLRLDSLIEVPGKTSQFHRSSQGQPLRALCELWVKEPSREGKPGGPEEKERCSQLHSAGGGGGAQV